MAIAGPTGFDLIHNLEALSQSCVLVLLLLSRENWKTYSLSSISCYIFSCRIGITYSYCEDECRINAEFLCSAISWNVAQELIRRPSTQLLVQEPSVWVCQVVRKFVKRKWKQQRIKQDTRVQNWRAMIHWRVKKRIRQVGPKGLVTRIEWLPEMTKEYPAGSCWDTSINEQVSWGACWSKQLPNSIQEKT